MLEGVDVIYLYQSKKRSILASSLLRVEYVLPGGHFGIYEIAIIMKSVMPTFGICQVRILQEVWLSYH